MPDQSRNPEASTQAISDWLIQQGVLGMAQGEILEGYCAKLLAAGLPLQRVHVAQRAVHPQYGSIGFDWVRDKGMEKEHYEHTSDVPNQDWLNSPLRYLMLLDGHEMRERLPAGGPASRFPFLDILRERGGRDYFASKMQFSDPAGQLSFDPENPPEGMLISWTSDAEDGFSDADLELLRALLPPLGLALKSASNRQLADHVASVYLGADAANRVISGEIQRGSFENIHAVIWYFDLQGFTKLSERIGGADNIAMLNAYFGEVVSVVESNGGNVLKFMGDGLLAIFNYEAMENVVDCALDAAIALRNRIDRLNIQREKDGLPVTDFNLALHGGDVLYGNIGGEARLDFTVIGSSVNKTARILGMGGQLEQKLIMSSTVAESAEAHRDQLVSLGRYMLRGVSEPQELFTLYRPDNEAHLP